MRRCRDGGKAERPALRIPDLSNFAAARQLSSPTPPVAIADGIPNASAGADRAREALSLCLDATGRLPCVEPSDCRMLRAGLAGRTVSVLFVAQRRALTSGVVNALLGVRVLPLFGAALKTTVVHVRFGPTPTARVELCGGRSRDIAFRLTGETIRKVAFNGAIRPWRIVLEQPSSWLASGVRLIEAPPVGSLYEYNRHVAHSYLPCVDAIVFVCSASRPLTRTEVEFLQELRSHGEKVFCLIDETDEWRPEPLDGAPARVRRRIERVVGVGVPIFAVSATLALASKLDRTVGFPTDPAFAAFEQDLRRLLVERENERPLETVAEGLLRVLSHAASRLGLELTALVAPPVEVARLAPVFRHAREVLDKARRAAQAALEADATALLREEVEPALERFKGDQHRRARAFGALGDRSARRGNSVVRRVPRHAAIRGAFAGWIMREERVVSRAFDAVCSRFWNEVQRAVDQFVYSVGELAGETVPRFDQAARARSGPPWRSEPRRAFWRRSTTLRLRWTLCDAAYPRVIRHPGSIVRDPTAAERIEAHAWRIRRDLEWRIRRSTEEACREATHRANAAIASMREALEHAAALRYGDASRLGARCDELASALTAVASLEVQVYSIPRGRS